MISLWLDDSGIASFDIEYVRMQLRRLELTQCLISPSLHTPIAPLVRVLQQDRIAFEVMLPVPMAWVKGYLKRHDRTLYDELLWLEKHAKKIREPLPFWWVTPTSYWENKEDFTFQRYMAAKEMSRMDEGMMIIASQEALASTAPSCAGDIYRMRVREHGAMPVWKAVLLSERSDRNKVSLSCRKQTIGRKGVRRTARRHTETRCAVTA